jgi:serine/threonine protein kinase
MEAINEVTILARMDSPHIVQYFDSFVEDDTLHIVMEFCNRGDLSGLLKQYR